MRARTRIERREHGFSGIEIWVADVGRKVLGAPPVRTRESANQESV